MIKDLGLNPETIVLVGDTCHDQEVALYLGLNAVLFTGGHYSRERLVSCKAILIDKLADLPLIIQSLEA